MSGRALASAFSALAFLGGCATSIQDAQRLDASPAAADSLVFVWSAAKAPRQNNLPALGAGIGIRFERYFANYDAEFAAFGASLRSQVGGVPRLARASIETLPPRGSQPQLDEAIRGARPSAAVVVMQPETVISYCLAGCYSFMVRVDVLAPVNRRRLWTALVTVPPKANHRDSFDPRALDYLATLAERLGSERLLAGDAREPARPQAAAVQAPVRTHRKQTPPATAFARFDDAAAVPVRPEGRDRYLHYLGLPSPKAFVVYQSGGWRFFFDDADAMTKALDRCARDNAPCWLYAVDDQVVWEPAPDKRVGRSDQLEDR